MNSVISVEAVLTFAGAGEKEVKFWVLDGCVSIAVAISKVVSVVPEVVPSVEGLLAKFDTTGEVPWPRDEGGSTAVLVGLREVAVVLSGEKVVTERR